jgi:predicted histidine transporter YuiF (NhaC family)
MKKLWLVLAILFTVLTVTLSILPFDTLAFLPIGFALIFGLLLLKKSEENQKKTPKILLTITAVCSAFVLGKTLFVKDEVEIDQTFEKQKTETQQEAKKELEELEQLENDLE